MSKEQDLAHGSVSTVGGIQNVELITHCMTRVRITLRDESLASIEDLKRVPGVIGVIEESTLQIIVGPGRVEKVSRVLADISGVELGEPVPLQSAHAFTNPDRRRN
ncbi:hypothetical protein AMQ83_03460 [Paenibacillus riograndensis]|nr:hypothetical protein AMQ83_03460 [Paenibacillus riograndensis]